MKYTRLFPGPLVLSLLLAGAAGAAEPTAVAPPTRMDQVQREAVNPMRRILEAATVVRSKVRVVEPARPGAAPGTAAATGNAAATPAVPGAVVQRSAVAPAAAAGNGVQPAEATAPAGQISRSLAASPAAAAPADAVARGAAEPLSAAAPAAGDTLARRPEGTASIAGAGDALTETRASPVLLAAAAPATAPSPAAQTLARTAALAAETPEMLSMVEPVVPARLRSRLPPELRLRLDLTIERDGSVREVALLGPVDRQLAPLVVGAVRQWRYAPLSTPRTHNVELLLNFTE